MKRFLLKSLAFVMMIGYSFSIFAATTPAANDGKWYYVKSQRYESGTGPFWTIGTDKVVPDAMTKSNSQKFTLISIGAEGKVGVQAYGTDGTDGVIRLNSSMSWTKDAGNAFVTLAVGDIDCGAF